MTQTELAARVADRLHLTRRQTEAIVDIMFRCITEALGAGDKVELRGFGSFRTRSRSARQGHNPRTGDVVQVPPRKTPFFKPGKDLREKAGSLENRQAAGGCHQRPLQARPLSSTRSLAPRPPDRVPGVPAVSVTGR